MKFWEAMKAVDDGMTVKIKVLDKAHPFRHIVGADWFALLASEWELYEETKMTCTFREVVEGLKQDKKFRRKGWISSVYIQASPYLKIVTLQNSGSECLSIEDYEATDWIDVTNEWVN